MEKLQSNLLLKTKNSTLLDLLMQGLESIYCMKILHSDLKLAILWFFMCSDNRESMARYVFAVFFLLIDFEIYFTKIHHAMLFTMSNDHKGW